MLVHNWTTVPRPPKHTQTLCEYIKYCHSKRLQSSSTRTLFHNKSVCAALVVKDGTGRQKHSGRGGGGGLHCMKEAVDKCSWVHLYTGQFKSAQWREKTQLSSKHQRIPVMMKTHNISSNSIPHCFNNNNNKKKLKQNKKSIISVPKPIIQPCLTPSIKKDVSTNKSI